jgi:hypothetical protein
MKNLKINKNRFAMLFHPANCEYFLSFHSCKKFETKPNYLTVVFMVHFRINHYHNISLLVITLYPRNPFLVNIKKLLILGSFVE